MAYFIVGLGNPGEKYKYTRHNAGFLAVDWLAEQAGAGWQTKPRLKAQISRLDSGGKKIFLVKPLTFMNNSGQALRAVLAYYQVAPKTWGLFWPKNADLTSYLLIIHDDLDIELGKFKKSANKSAAGHKGVQSAISYLKTKNFYRLRLGIKPQNFSLAGQAKDKYVLSRFNKEELNALKKIFSSAKFKQALNLE